jgi:RNA polymerase sigma-70 factor (ECF subfamily)
LRRVSTRTDSGRSRRGRGTTAPPEALLTAAELRACLQKHLEHLPPDQRTVLWLRDIEGTELADIAAITELAEGNVRVLLHRGRQRLQVMIERFEREDTC